MNIFFFGVFFCFICVFFCFKQKKKKKTDKGGRRGGGGGGGGESVRAYLWRGVKAFLWKKQTCLECGVFIYCNLIRQRMKVWRNAKEFIITTEVKWQLLKDKNENTLQKNLDSSLEIS